MLYTDVRPESKSDVNLCISDITFVRGWYGRYTPRILYRRRRRSVASKLKFFTLFHKKKLIKFVPIFPLTYTKRF